jgi:hypothetical protein
MIFEQKYYSRGYFQTVNTKHLESLVVNHRQKAKECKTKRPNPGIQRSGKGEIPGRFNPFSLKNLKQRLGCLMRLKPPAYNIPDRIPYIVADYHPYSGQMIPGLVCLGADWATTPESPDVPARTRVPGSREKPGSRRMMKYCD